MMNALARRRIRGTGLALVLATMACGDASERPATAEAASVDAEALFIQYLGNEGFLVRSGDATVLLDGLIRDGIPPYVRPPDGIRRQLETAEPPYDAINVALASHFHTDHFDPDAVADFLRAAPSAEFVSTPQAAHQVRTVLAATAPEDTATTRRVHGVLPAEGQRDTLELEGIGVEVLNLHHGRNRNPPVENLGLLVTVGKWTLLHIGDTQASLDEIAKNDLAADSIDVAFVPYWRLLEDDGPRLVSEVLGARHLVVMHVPGREASDDYFGRARTREAMVERLREVYPNAVILLEPLESSELRKD